MTPRLKFYSDLDKGLESTQMVILHVTVFELREKFWKNNTIVMTIPFTESLPGASHFPKLFCMY